MEELCYELKSVIRFLLTHKCVGGVHTPESFLFKRFKNVHDKQIRKKIAVQWFELEREGFIIRMKKRTRKGSDYHISLNPSFVPLLREMSKPTDQR